MEEKSNEEVSAILKEHKEYFDRGETRDIDFRLKQLGRLKKAIQDNEKQIMDALYEDLHKPEFEAYATEVGYLLDSIGFMSRNLKYWARPKKVKTPVVHIGSSSHIYYEPYGTALIIGPFNYPFQLVFEPLVGAIAAGNCAVIKPSRYTPNIANVTEKIIRETFDREYIRVVGGGRETTTALLNSPFDYIFFTGSVKVGKVVMEAAANNLVPVTLELGGKSPCIVDKDANLQIAAKRIAWGKFMNAGQTCVAPDYLLIHRDVKDEFLKLLIDTIKEFYGDDPQKSRDFGRIVSKEHAERLTGLLDREKIVHGGDYDIDSLYISPTVMDNVTWQDRVMEDEIFGPILPILVYEDIGSAIKTINSHPKPLALYVFTENKETAGRVIKYTSYGGGCVNDTVTHLATPFLPFGGVGNSGMGSYHGKASFETFSNAKGVLKKSTRFDLKFLYPPYNIKKMTLIKRFLK